MRHEISPYLGLDEIGSLSLMMNKHNEVLKFSISSSFPKTIT